LILFDWAQTHGTGDILDDKEKDEKKAKERMNVGKECTGMIKKRMKRRA
jgi:hypothetical protein